MCQCKDGKCQCNVKVETHSDPLTSLNLVKENKSIVAELERKNSIPHPNPLTRMVVNPTVKVEITDEEAIKRVMEIGRKL